MIPDHVSAALTSRTMARSGVIFRLLILVGHIVLRVREAIRVGDRGVPRYAHRRPGLNDPCGYHTTSLTNPRLA